MEGAWIGRQARLPGAQLLSRAVGSRDLALGFGGVQAAIRDDGSLPAWMTAAAICDAVDFGATYAAGRRIPQRSRVTVLGVAAGSAVFSAIAAVATAKRRPAGLDLSGTEDITEAGVVPSEPVGTA